MRDNSNQYKNKTSKRLFFNITPKSINKNVNTFHDMLTEIIYIYIYMCVCVCVCVCVCNKWLQNKHHFNKNVKWNKMLKRQQGEKYKY